MEPVASPRRRQELVILTSYSESVFLLASRMSIGRKPVELLPAPGVGRSYVLQCEWPYFQIPFEKVLTPVVELLQSCGASRVGKFWSEPSPVFDVDFDSQASIHKMIVSLESGRICECMESIILPLAQRAWSQTNPDSTPEWKIDISLDLLQVLPNADTKDAIVHRVSSTNVSMCAHLWNERKVFDIGALLRWYRSKPLGGIMGESSVASGNIKLLDLMRELNEVVGWMQLGLQLGVPKHTLEKIRQQYAMYGEVMCKTEMLSTWLDSRVEEPTWAEVVSAVSRTGNKRVARKIANKYGLALAVSIEVTEIPSDAPVPNSPLESLKMEMEETDRAIEDNETKLQICNRKKRKLDDYIVETQHNCDIVQRYTEMLTKDKESLEEKLEEREKEIRSLQAQQLEYERTIRGLEVKLATAGAKAKQKLKDKLKLLKQEKTELVERIDAKEKEASKLTKSISKLRLKRDCAKTELSVALSQLELKTSQLDEVQQELQLVQDQRDKLMKQLEMQEKGMEEAVMQFVDIEKVACKAEPREEPTRSSSGAVKEVPPPMVPSANVKLQFQNWSHRRDMPHGMASAQAVLLDGNVYIGGGYTDKYKDAYVILVYNPEGDEWSQLPSCPVRSFAMASVNHQLVLAGGLERGRHEASNKLVVWNSTSHTGWTLPYPPMPTAHSNASAIGYQCYLVVAGGWRSVEILDTSSSQWHTAKQLPVGCESMTSAVLGDTLYLLGGTTVSPMQVLATSLPSLISDATSHFLRPAIPPLWVNLPNTPLKNSTASVLQNSLLAIGGQTDMCEPDFKIHLYNPLSGSWVKVGDMPVRRSHLTSAVLSSGAVFVCGGLDKHDGVYSNQVYTVTSTSI